MSVFNEDIIEKDLDYRADPDENMAFQINRAFVMMVEDYNPSFDIGVCDYVAGRMETFMNQLADNAFRLESRYILPDWWNGPFMCIRQWRINKILGRNTGVSVRWCYTNDMEWCAVDLFINTDVVNQTYKDWVL